MTQFQCSFKVCWHWKYLSEDNRLWQMKCQKLSWIMTDSAVTHYAVPNWKLFFINQILSLRKDPNEPKPREVVHVKRTEKSLPVRPNRSQQLRSKGISDKDMGPSANFQKPTKPTTKKDKRASISHPTTPNLRRSTSAFKTSKM